MKTLVMLVLMLLMLLMLLPLPVLGMADKTMMMDNACPMKLAPEIAVADTSDGVVLTLTTKAQNVAELRLRIERWATMHAVDRITAGMMQGMRMPATIKYAPIENGAALTMIPRDPARLEEFRTRIRIRVEEMKKTDCAMMREMMQGMMGGPMMQGSH